MCRGSRCTASSSRRRSSAAEVAQGGGCGAWIVDAPIVARLAEAWPQLGRAARRRRVWCWWGCGRCASGAGW